MNLVRLKNMPVIPGLDVEVVREGEAIKRLEIRYGAGELLAVEYTAYSNGLQLFGIAPPKTKKVWRVTGESFVGSASVKIQHDFDTQSEADRFAGKLDEGAVTAELDIVVTEE